MDLLETQITMEKLEPILKNIKEGKHPLGLPLFISALVMLFYRPGFKPILIK
jgi:hypothetical protein